MFIESMVSVESTLVGADDGTLGCDANEASEELP